MALCYFCPKCGGKNLYQLQKPKFCSACGTSFAVAVQEKTIIKSPTFEVNIKQDARNIAPINKNHTPRIENDNDNFDGEEFYDYSSMRGLDVEISASKNTGVRLDDLISTSDGQDNLNIEKKDKVKQKRPRGRKKVIKTLPESFVSETRMTGRASLRNQEDIEINE
jgi:hypothetical protein